MNFEKDIIKDKAQIWIYVLELKNWTELKKIKGETLYISSILNHYIKKDDIIIIYCSDSKKNSKSAGFIGLAQAKNNQYKNTIGETRLVIYNDANMNNYIVGLNFMDILKQEIKIKDIMPALADDKIGFRSEPSFKHKFTRGTGAFYLIDKSKGTLLIEKLCEINDTEIIMDNVSELIEEEVEEEIVVKKPKKITKTKTKPKKITKAKPKPKKISNLILSNSTIDSESSGLSDSDSDSELDNYKNSSNDEDNDENNDEDNDEDNDGDNDEEIKIDNDSEQNPYTIERIPILIILCKEYKWPIENVDRCDYFINHYDQCTKCTIINNNNSELISIFNNADCIASFYEIDENTDLDSAPDIEKIIDAYDRCQIYFSPEWNETKPDDPYTGLLNIIYLNNGHDIYDQCIFVVWCK